MSLILDALKRAEGGAASDADQAQNYLRTSTPAPVRRLRLRGGLVLGLTMGLVIAWGADRLWEQHTVPEDARTDLPATQETPPLTPAPERPVVIASRLEGVSVPPTVSDREAVSELNARMWADAERLTEPGDSTDSTQASAATETFGSMEEERVDTTLSEQIAKADGQSALDAEAEIDLVELLARVAADSGEVALEPHPALLLENLSQQAKDQIPSIVYSQHSFGSGGDSFVTLNGSTLRVGQRVGPIEVREILSDSVVLRVGSTEFRLRALNTWVNL